MQERTTPEHTPHFEIQRIYVKDLSFEAPEITMDKVMITRQYVEEKLGAISRNKDLSRFIL